MKRYGQYYPPEYDLRNFSVPTAIFKGDIDELADPADVAWLLSD